MLEGSPVELNGYRIPMFGAAKIIKEKELHVKAENDAELLLVDVLL